MNINKQIYNLIKKIFSIENSANKTHKIVIILGIRCKYKVFKLYSKLRNQMMNKIKYESSSLIKSTDKVLVIAPHPDDEVIGCGGIIAKYSSQIDVLCINSSGVKYEWNVESAEEIAQIRCDEFYNVMKLAGINKSYIAKIWGIPPMFEDIKSNINNYLKNINLKDYDVIFIPHQFDGHREHRFVGNYLVKKLLKKNGFKKDLKIVRYEVWGTLQAPNYYEDITNFVDKKRELIDLYVSRNKAHYADRILALNYYRAIIASFKDVNSFAEAFCVQSIQDYLREKDDRSWSKE